MTPEQATRIRELNDAFRTNPFGEGGKTMITQGVSAKGLIFSVQAQRAVQAFTDFNDDNDPHGEHDGATFIVDETLCYWKIDYFDPDMLHGSEAPWDEAATCRVLTIMLMEEY